MQQYFITNRPILVVGDTEKIIFDDKTCASEVLRFGHTNADCSDFILYPDINLDNQFQRINYEAVNETEAKGSALFFKNIYTDMLQKGCDGIYDLCLLIPGFSNDKKSTLEILKSLQEKYIGQIESPIEQAAIYIWPTNGSCLEYRDDKKDAEVSGFTLGRAFLKLQRFFRDFFIKSQNPACNNKIHLICHSMGNYVLESMMRMLITSGKPLTKLFSEVILVGADIDYSAFEPENPLSHLTDICERVHIYYNRNDFALQISEHTKNAFNRLGKHGPKNIINNPNVVVVDVTEVVDKCNLKEKLFHHWYHFNSKTIIKDINALLSGKKADEMPDRSYNEFRREFILK